MFNYIINKNHEIQYFDEEFKIYYPNLKPGDICYKALCGNDAPCYGCPHEVPKDRRWSLFNKVLRQWVNVHYCPMNWQKDDDNILVSVEITEGEEHCHHEKNALTGILSREHFLIQAANFLQAHPDRKWCLAAVDIDNFKLFNEWFGQDAGDQILKSFGDYFHNLQTHTDSVAGYFGGDDFYVIIPDSSEFINNMWEALSSFAAKFREGNVFLPAIGIYPIHDITTRISTMCDMAQLAVNSVKTDYRKHIERFDNELFRQLEKRQNLILDIQKAMQNREFCFYLQPKCNMDNDKIISFEALVRWLHPTFGMIPPSEYIPFLEKSRLITELDLYIWESVCIQLAKWRDAGIRLVPISVNVSVADIYAIDVPETFIQLAEKYQIPPRYIIIEITESAYVENFDTVKENISRLQRHGFAVSMDDFGSGYSSLNMLKDINVDIIKIDMKFLHMNETTREKGLNILSSIIRLVNVLNIRMVAEGVETQAQIKALLTMGCKYGQGYYFYRPLPVSEAEKLLCDHSLIDERGISDNLFNQLSINDLMGKGIIGDKLISELLGPTVICEVQDNRFRVLKINNDALDLLKVTLPEVEDEQESIVNHYFGGDISELLACFETSYENKPERNKFIVKGMRRNGNPLWLELKICFLQEREKWHMYFMTLQDVTPEFGIPKPTVEQVLLECYRQLDYRI